MIQNPECNGRPREDTMAAMEGRWIECVMNVSEGRRDSVLNPISRAVRSSSGTFLLSVSSDSDHNRSVFSFISTPSQIVRACLAAIKEAVEGIDLRRHQGVHPRIGAADVVPLVPLGGVTVQDCLPLARTLGERVWRDLRVPVYFYEYSAERPGRSNLAVIRRGGFETLRDRVGDDPSRFPDLGEARLHPSAGAVVVGVREALIAWNVYLKHGSLKDARELARRIRERDGGMPAVKALGFFIGKRNQAQVSMNLTDYRRSSPILVHRRLRVEAARLGVELGSSELIGHIPRAALAPGQERELGIENFHPGMILENRIEEVLRGAEASPDPPG